MGHLRAVYVLSAVLFGLLLTVAALYTVANPRAQLEARSAIHAAALDAFHLPFVDDRDPPRTCLSGWKISALTVSNSQAVGIHSARPT